LITEFEGTTEEFEMLLNKGYVIPKDAKWFYPHFVRRT
jgi:hypothetical protein